MVHAEGNANKVHDTLCMVTTIVRRCLRSGLHNMPPGILRAQPHRYLYLYDHFQLIHSRTQSLLLRDLSSILLNYTGHIYQPAA